MIHEAQPIPPPPVKTEASRGGGGGGGGTITTTQKQRGSIWIEAHLHGASCVGEVGHQI